jgi:hypothetical protein
VSSLFLASSLRALKTLAIVGAAGVTRGGKKKTDGFEQVLASRGRPPLVGYFQDKKAWLCPNLVSLS